MKLRKTQQISLCGVIGGFLAASGVAAAEGGYPVDVQPAPATTAAPAVAGDVLAQFCAPNKNYGNFRVCELKWRLHYKWPQAYNGDANGPPTLGGQNINRGDGERGSLFVQPVIGSAVDLGQRLGINMIPYATVDNPGKADEGLIWRWSKPTSAEWNRYVFCHAIGEANAHTNAWRVPKQGGTKVHINWNGQEVRDNSWGYVIGGTQGQGFGNRIGKSTRIDIGQWVTYVYVDIGDQKAAIEKKICVSHAPYGP